MIDPLDVNQHKGKIYCGKRVFKLLMTKTKSAPMNDTEFFYGGITFLYNCTLSDSQALTLDPELKTILEALEK